MPPSGKSNRPLLPPPYRPAPVGAMQRQASPNNRRGGLGAPLQGPAGFPPAAQRVPASSAQRAKADRLSIMAQLKAAPASQGVFIHAARPSLQPKSAGAVQVKGGGGAGHHLKPYPNLHPSAALPVSRSEIYSLHDNFGHYTTTRPQVHGIQVPNAKYIFVRTTDGELLLHPRHRHPTLADGKPVAYAGEMWFDNGNLAWWSNGSGHYQPDADHAVQANLPMERFYTFDQIQRGVQHRPRSLNAQEKGEKP